MRFTLLRIFLAVHSDMINHRTQVGFAPSSDNITV